MNVSALKSLRVLFFSGFLIGGGSHAEVLAQSVGNCTPSVGEAILDANHVRARIPNNGELFFRGEPHVYHVPTSGKANAIYAAGIWVGGEVDGAVHMVASQYGPFEFWAGPLDEQGRPPSDCKAYDRVFKVNREEVIHYESTGTVSEDLLAWPTGLGAPTLDASGRRISLLDAPLAERKDRVIDLDAGERPAIKGDQSLWWVMNDRGNEHRATGSPALGVEVHGFAFAAQSSVDAINNATMYTFRLINRNASRLDRAYFGFFVDPDLGNPRDDYVGSDSVRGIGFVYNADNLDDGGEAYGTPPPALGVQFLRSPLAEDDGLDNDHDGAVDEAGEMLGLTHFSLFSDGEGANGVPQVEQEYYNYLQGRWKNGERWTMGGAGYGFSNTTTNFIYPGDPVTDAYWSERNIDGAGNASPVGDRKFLVSSGPFTLEPGQDTEFTFSIVWAKGEDHLDSVTAMKAAAEVVQSAYDKGFMEIPR